MYVKRGETKTSKQVNELDHVQNMAKSIKKMIQVSSRVFCGVFKKGLLRRGFELRPDG